LTLILPIVYYHGEEDWEMKGLFEFLNDYPDDFKKYIPNHDTAFISLKKMSEEDRKI
jgi:hypothetical protein